MSVQQISVFLENKPGTLKKMTGVLADHKIDMRATSLAETKDFGIGVLIDVLPYDSKAVFDEQHILDRLDTIMKRQVPGSAPDSYMGIERRRDEQGEYLLPIVTRQVEFDSCPFATETRGCWRTYGDFMGGPFVTYTVLSPSEKRVVMLTGYVFCPRNKPTSKRDLLMQVESICRTLKF